MSPVQQHGVRAEPADHAHTVGDEQDGGPRVPELVHPLQGLLLEGRVAGREGLVYDQDVRLDVDRDGEAQSGLHAARVGPDGVVDKVPDIRERLYLLEPVEHLAAVHPQDQAVHHGVLAARELGVEAGPQPEDGGEAAVYLDRARRRLQDAGDDLEQRALPRPVAAEDA